MNSLNGKFTLAFLLLCFLFTETSAQDFWSLERCIQYAQQNSLTIKQAEYAIESAQLQEKSSKAERYPSLNASGSFGIQSGRTIDPTTNSFVNQNVSFNSYGLNANATLFNGFRIKNSIEQSQIDVKAARKDAESTNNNMALSIASAYLQILLSEEQAVNATRQLEQANEQLSQTDKLINAGVLPQNDRLDILAQVALNEQTVVQAQNGVEAAYLTLKQFLELDPSKEITVEKPRVVIPEDANPEVLTLNGVYTQALSTQPQIEAGELRAESAEIGIDIAKSGKLPSLSIFGGLSSNWSSAAKDFENPEETGPPIVTQGPPLDVVINGDDASLSIFDIQPQFKFNNLAYGTQLSQNFGQNIGVSLNVPIFNRFSNDINMERAELNIKNQQVLNNQAKQRLKSDIQTAIANARAAKKSYEASQRANEAATAAFNNAQRRFDLGAINTFEFSTAKANLDRSEIDLTTAKYQYLFNLKVVDFYVGKKLTLKD
ncbi:MAG: outer membrane protein [Saprospiraceae bacterium]|jgi:outer membrane protein